MRRLHPEGPEEQRELLQRYASVEVDQALVAAAPRPVTGIYDGPQPTTEGAPLVDDVDSDIETELEEPSARDATAIVKAPEFDDLPSVTVIGDVTQTEQKREEQEGEEGAKGGGS